MLEDPQLFLDVIATYKLHRTSKARLESFQLSMDVGEETVNRNERKVHMLSVVLLTSRTDGDLSSTVPAWSQGLHCLSSHWRPFVAFQSVVVISLRHVLSAQMQLFYWMLFAGSDGRMRIAKRKSRQPAHLFDFQNMNR